MIHDMPCCALDAPVVTVCRDAHNFLLCVIQTDILQTHCERPHQTPSPYRDLFKLKLVIQRYDLTKEIMDTNNET